MRLASCLAIAASLLCGMGWATSLPAQEDGTAAVATARASADPVAALSALIRDCEIRLAGLRADLIAAIEEEERVEARLSERREQIGAVLIALERAGQPPDDDPLPHPEGALAGARAAQVLAGIVPALRAEIALFESDRDRFARLIADRREATKTMETVLEQAETARADLTAAVYERQDQELERGVAPTGNGKLAALATTATDFAEIIEALPKRPAAPAGDAPANLPLPVAGQVLRGFNEPDGDGRVRPGVTLLTQPAALVTAPTRAIVRYAGPVRRGRAVILEPAPGHFIVLSGLNRLFVTEGEMLSAGAPVGLMGGHAPASDTIAPAPEEHAGAPNAERLYIEARDAITAVDPMRWFAVRKD